MNGASDGTTASSSSGTNAQSNSLSQALRALDIIYNPRSTNDARREATLYLEQAKLDSNAPSAGFQLALNSNNAAHVRHYGLSMLEHAVRYQWQDYDSYHHRTIRDWIVDLAHNVQADQPLFFRNKIAQLWVEIVKRCWLTEWLEMDEALQELWQLSQIHQEVVLYILETLSEDLFSMKDPAGAGRDTELGAACVAIFTEQRVLDRAGPSRAGSLSVRHGEDGWLKRLMSHLPVWLPQAANNSDKAVSCAAKAFGVFRVAMTWVMLRSVSNLSCILVFCNYLTFPRIEIQMVS